MSLRTSCKMPLAWDVQVVLPDGVVESVVELDMVPGGMRFVVRDRSKDASCVQRTLTLFCRRGCDRRGRGSDGGGGAVWNAGRLARADASCV